MDGSYPTVTIRQTMWALKLNQYRENDGKRALIDEIFSEIYMLLYEDKERRDREYDIIYNIITYTDNISGICSNLN